MRRSFRISSVVLACAGAVSAAGATAAAAAPASAAAPAACATTQTIEISSLAFQPPAVAPGQSSEAVLTAVNCTAQTQQASAEWLGRFVGPAPGIPTGCPAIDPIVFSMTFPPHGVLTDGVGYLVPGSCTATELVVTVEIIQQGRVVTQRSAQLAIEQPLH